LRAADPDGVFPEQLGAFAGQPPPQALGQDAFPRGAGFQALEQGIQRRGGFFFSASG
jgi:hypothetical protein